MILFESSRIERVAILTQKLITDGEIRTAEAAAECGVTPRTIRRDLAEIARVLPVYVESGRWIYLPDDEPITISPV